MILLWAAAYFFFFFGSNIFFVLPEESGGTGLGFGQSQYQNSKWLLQLLILIQKGCQMCVCEEASFQKFFNFCCSHRGGDECVSLRGDWWRGSNPLKDKLTGRLCKRMYSMTDSERSMHVGNHMVINPSEPEPISSAGQRSEVINRQSRENWWWYWHL